MTDDLPSVSWDDLVSTALLGTERRPVSPSPAIVDTSIRNTSTSEAQTALRLGGLIGLGREATLRVQMIEVSNDPSSKPHASLAETRPEANASATQLLDLVLSANVAVAGQNDKLIGQWLTGCNRHQRRIARSQILPVLNRATQHSECRVDAAAVIGERGAFVAQRNPQWSWVTETVSVQTAASNPAEISTDVLVAADPAVKAQYAMEWRSRDATLARQIIAEALPQENAPDRTALIRALAIGLSSEDEPMLEAALDDKAKGVREMAQWVLAQLPTSSFAQRMSARLEPLIKTRRLPRFSLQVELPDVPENDPTWNRDGLGKGVTRSDALRKIVEATPITWWEHKFDRPLIDLIDKVLGSDTQREVIGGIAGSAVSVGRTALTDTDWLVPLWARLSEPSAMTEANKWWQEKSHLVSLMSPAEVTSLLAVGIRTGFNLPLLYEALSGQDRIALTEQVTAATNVADDIARALINKPNESHQLLSHHNIGLIIANTSEPVLEQLIASVADIPSLANRLRHVQAAISLSHAIAKEFP